MKEHLQQARESLRLAFKEIDPLQRKMLHAAIGLALDEVIYGLHLIEIEEGPIDPTRAVPRFPEERTIRRASDAKTRASGDRSND